MTARRLLWVCLGIGLMLAPRARPQDPLQRTEPVAETKLLMEGLTSPNMKSLEKLLSQKPTEAQTWSFARGQALLIAETGNLLLLRPPKNQGKEVWTKRAVELREAATLLARQIANQDHPRSQFALVRVANVCNRCHQSFRIPVEIDPFKKAPK